MNTLIPIRITQHQSNNQLLYFTSSSLTKDNKNLVFISDRTGHPNLFVLNLLTGKERQLTYNEDGYLKSYKYFDGQKLKGFGKASVCLHADSGKIYYLQGNEIHCVDINGNHRVLAEYPKDQVTAYTHVSSDGTLLCMPTTDARAFDIADARKNYSDMDKYVQEKNLNSYLRIYDTGSGKEIATECVSRAWVTHVQFCPANKNLVLYNHEWSSASGTQRMWLWNGAYHKALRPAKNGHRKSDWTCHEVWEQNGKSIIYHGTNKHGRGFIGRVNADGTNLTEIYMPIHYIDYGHLAVHDASLLVSDGCYQKLFPAIKILLKVNILNNNIWKAGKWISLQKADWEKKRIKWIPLCKHKSGWNSEDEHPHPIFNHSGTAVFFNSVTDNVRSIYKVDIQCIRNSAQGQFDAFVSSKQQ